MDYRLPLPTTETTPSDIGPTNPRIKDNSARRAFKIFVENEGALKKFFDEENAKKELTTNGSLRMPRLTKK